MLFLSFLIYACIVTKVSGSYFKFMSIFLFPIAHNASDFAKAMEDIAAVNTEFILSLMKGSFLAALVLNLLKDIFERILNFIIE